MYNVSEYSNRGQDLEDTSMREDNNLIEIDKSNDAAQDNDYNMSGEENNFTDKSTNKQVENEIDEINAELLSSGDEELNTEIHEIETDDNGENYRKPEEEFNSEDEIENLEEEGQANDSVVKLDELNNFEDHEDVQEIPPPVNSTHEYSKHERESKLEDQESHEKVRKKEVDNNAKEVEQNEKIIQESYEELNDQEEVEDDADDNYGDYDEKEEEIKEEIKEEIEEENQAGEVLNDELKNKTDHENNIHEAIHKSMNDYKSENNLTVDNEGDKNSEGVKEETNPDDTNYDAQSKLTITFPIIINIAETDFLLVPFEKHKNPTIDISHLVSLYDDNDILKLNIEEFFGLMRTNEDLNEIHQFTVNKELVLVVPELNNLSITEDNIYSRDITVEDFIESFDSLQANSISAGETSSHNSISFLLTSQTRFITNFNKLSESIRAGKGFSCTTLEASERIAKDGKIADVDSSAPPIEDSHKRHSQDSDDDEARQAKRMKTTT